MEDNKTYVIVQPEDYLFESKGVYIYIPKDLATEDIVNAAAEVIVAVNDYKEE